MSYNYTVKCFHFQDDESKEHVCLILPLEDSPDDKSKLQDTLFFSQHIQGDFAIVYQTDTGWILRGPSKLLESLQELNIEEQEYRQLVFSTKAASRASR